MSNEGFLNRWSRLKRDSHAPAPAPAAQPASPAAVVPASPSAPELGREGPEAREAGSDQATVARPAPSAATIGATPARNAEPAQSLPSLDQLSFESDFSPFMRAEVDPARRMSALKKLFSDPHFNRMDGLDVYIDDYTKPDPIPKAMLARLNQSRLLGLFEEEEAKGEQDAGRVLAAEGKAAEGNPAEGAAARDEAAKESAVEVAAAQESRGQGPAQAAVPSGDAASPRGALGHASECDRPADAQPASEPDSPPEVRQAT